MSFAHRSDAGRWLASGWSTSAGRTSWSSGYPGAASRSPSRSRGRGGATGRHRGPQVRPPRYLAGRWQGVSYRSRGGRPDPIVSGTVLANRIRSSLAPLETGMDLPHVHVMAADHIALLHDDVATAEQAERIEAAVAAVSGVEGLESYCMWPAAQRHPTLGRGAPAASVCGSTQAARCRHRRRPRRAARAGGTPGDPGRLLRTASAGEPVVTSVCVDVNGGLRPVADDYRAAFAPRPTNCTTAPRLLATGAVAPAERPRAPGGHAVHFERAERAR